MSAYEGKLRLLVCGGRRFGVKLSERELFLDAITPLTARVALVIHGGAGGADVLAAEWADLECIPCMSFVAPWEHFRAKGKGHVASAGPVRNAWMLEWGEPDLVLSFPPGKAARQGTLDDSAELLRVDLCERARAAGVEVREVRP